MLYSPNDIKRRLEQNWYELVRQNAGKLSSEYIDGSSPPSVFVGRYGYPKVNVGPMIPFVHGDTTIMDAPELWDGKTIEQIAAFRIGLVRGTAPVRVDAISGRYIRTLQELALSKRPVDSEAKLEKKLLRKLEFESELRLSGNAAPFGPAAPIKDLKTGSLSTDKTIEKAYYDSDLKAEDAITTLYQKGVPVTTLHRVLSIGMLGLEKKRKLVPTRWSITATDDIISKKLVHELETNTSIDAIAVFKYAHLGNYYSVLVMPTDAWAFEMIEAWETASGGMAMGIDSEDHKGLKGYPSIAGAYFAARLAVAEYLHRIKRKSSCLVIREITKEYVLPLGVWQIRQGVRSALSEDATVFDSLQKAIQFAFSELTISQGETLVKSKLLRKIREQRKITDFA